MSDPVKIIIDRIGLGAPLDGRVYATKAETGADAPHATARVFTLSPLSYTNDGSTVKQDATAEITLTANTYGELQSCVSFVRGRLDDFVGTAGGVAVSCILLTDIGGERRVSPAEASKRGLFELDMTYRVVYAQT